MLLQIRPLVRERPPPGGSVYRIFPIGYFRSCQRVEREPPFNEGSGLVLYYKTDADCQVIVVRLREMIHAFEKRTGQRLTYAQLAARSGVARATVESLGSRRGYNATLDTVDKLCEALGCDLTDLVQRTASTKQQLRRPQKG